MIKKVLICSIFILVLSFAMYGTWYFISREETPKVDSLTLTDDSVELPVVKPTATPQTKTQPLLATKTPESANDFSEVLVIDSTPTPEVTPTPTPSFVTFEKTHNFLMGFYTPDFPPERNLRSWEEMLHVNFELVAWYQHWDQDANSNKLKYTCEMGKTPVITWESWNGRSELSENGNPYPLWDIAAGVFDELLTEQFESMHQTAIEFGCTEVWIRFDHEMNTPTGELHWYPWQGDPQNFVAAWQHVVDLSREVNFEEARWIYAPAWGNADANLYYPGSEYVDFIGLTKNQFWHDQFDLRFDKWEFRSFEELYQEDISLESWGHPIVIVESATGEGPEVDSKATWITKALEFVDSNDNIIGFVWYNADSAREFDDIIFRVDSSEAAIQAFQDFFGD